MKEENTMPDLEHADCTELVDELASRMNLSEEDTKRFRRECLTRAGYKPEVTYVKDSSSNSNEKSGGNRRESRRDDSDWYAS
jgi:hypothetical protein